MRTKNKHLLDILRTILVFIVAAGSCLQANAQTVSSWITNANQSALLQQQGAVNFTPGSGATVSVNPANTFQSVDGFGFCLTEGSCEAISALNATQQNNLLNEFFNTSTGMGVSVLRISIGASDLSSSSYSYDDAGPDANLNNFSLAGPDLNYVIPIVKRIIAINPNIKILATPWSAPRWMKTNNAWVGGSLNTAYYSAYANYFVKYINAMNAQGINIWAITPQNEPENPYNEPSMVMNAGEETNFINNNLGPALKNAGIVTKIIAYDHNLDDTGYPIQVCNNSSYVDGAAFHLYAGDVSAMSTVHNATGKNVYFTEQYTSTTGGFSGDFPWHMQNVMIGTMNNWSKTALEWNLATNAGFGPHTGGGCTTCLGAVTINNASDFTRNVSYYVVAQLSKFVKTGAVRIQSSSSDGSLQNVAFKNPDGSIVLVLFNSGGSRTFTVGTGSNTFSYTLPGSSAVSFVWSTGIPSTTDVVTAYKDCNYGGYSGGLAVGTYTSSQLNALGILDNDISSLKVAQGFKAILYDGDNFTGTSTEITSDNACLVSTGWNDLASSVKIVTNGATDITGTFFLQNRNSSLYMDVTGGIGATQDGANIQQWNPGGTTNQQFQFTHLGDGTYKIVAVHSQKSIDVASVSKDDGANVQQWTYFGSSNQQFVMVSTGDGYYKMIPKHSGKVVEVAGATTAPGGNVQQWSNNNQTCGQWKLIPLVTNGTGDGLLANYFNGMNFETPVYSRKEATINFDWGTGSPNAAVNADGFSARWTGQIQPRYSDAYTFYINSDNGRRLWINGQLIIDKWIDDWGIEYSGTITLTAGQKYDIKVEYFENNGGAGCKLEWSSGLQTREVVPTSQLYSNALPTVSIASPSNNATYSALANIALTVNASDNGSIAKIEYFNGTTKLGESSTAPYSFTWTNVAAGTYVLKARATDNMGAEAESSMITVVVNMSTTGTGDGLTGNYFNGMNFETPVYSRKEATINFDWGTGSPNALVNTDGFSARWSGQIQPKYSGAYTFYVNSDNGRRLWINGQLIVDKWIDDWGIEYTGTVTLAANQKYDIKLEYFENNGGAGCKLEWSSAAQTREVISTSQLYANPLPTVAISSPANNAVFDAATNIALTSAAGDNGSITKVEYYNGTTKLGESAVSPYNFIWNTVAAGTYALTARATDNQGGIAVSSSVSIKVNAVTPPTNIPPSVSLTAPAANSSYNAPASISIVANASDSDGSVVKVEFFNGTTKLGEDVTSPYSFSWTSVSAGTYTISAKATDDKGATTVSTGATVTVKAVTIDACSTLSSYAENNGYVAGSKVKNAGRQYECKEYPYSGWCNGASWAYAPGTGAYWTDAWYDRGACGARTSDATIETDQEAVLVSPNPATDVVHIHVSGASNVKVYNMQGVEVMSLSEVVPQGSINISSLSSGVYLIKIDTGLEIVTRFVVKN